MATLFRNTAVLNLRINLSITPDLTIQYWGQPFLFSGDYSKFKVTIDPRNENYFNQFYEYTENEIYYDEADNQIYIDETGDGEADYSFENPDFSVYDFRSNLVLRWEYIPGSFVYLVWSQGRYGDSPSGEFDFGKHLQDLSATAPTDVFLLKFSYRFSF